MTREINLDKDYLKELYYEEKMSFNKMAIFLGITKSVIIQRFKKWGFNSRGTYELNTGNKGKPQSEYQKKTLSKRMRGKKNPMWKGDDVGYCSLHEWIKNHKQKPEFCEECKKKKPYDLANISGKYKRDVNDFRWLCRSCHMKFDYNNGFRKKKIKKMPNLSKFKN